MATNKKARLVAVLFLLAGAAGCGTMKPIDPIPKEGTIKRSITWVLAEDPEKVCEQNFKKPLIGTRSACARVRGNECTIYVKPPRNEEDRHGIYILGHEALHCFIGNFHYAVN